MKICILTAGKGSRMENLTKNINKALLPVNNKAIISHIIEKFSINDEFVIGLGYKGKQVRDYLKTAHPDRKFKFVFIKNYDGLGSGPGYSLLNCKQYLQEPFFFVPCDCIFANKIYEKTNKNWIGIHKINVEESKDYCNVAIKNNIVTDIRDKEYCNNRYFAFTGLLFIHDFKEFWRSLKESYQIKGEHQISNGLKGLAQSSGLYTKIIKWIDIGNKEKYNAIQNKNKFSIVKSDEFIYFVNRRVIKFFSDKQIVQDRAKKSKIKPSIFPKVSISGEQFYSYPFYTGQTFYSCGNPRLFQNLLCWLEKKLWTPVKVEEKQMQKLCKNFYYNKTISRLHQFIKNHPTYQFPTRVNGQVVSPIPKLLKKIPWDKLNNGIPVFIHGDLQFQNILYNQRSRKFLLIDWRQDFAGIHEYGDLYYDIAKLLGGIHMNYDYIIKDAFKFITRKNNTLVKINKWKFQKKYLQILENFIISKKLNLNKIRLLVGLIYLNMAPLHNPPFSFALMALSSEIISKELGYEEITNL